MQTDAPKRINKYDVVDLIGRGERGVVYKAVDRALGRPVAIKMVTGGSAEPGDLLKRFYGEAKFTANLRHPNIVIVYDLGEYEGRPYLVMEYLNGQSLASMLARETIPMLEKISYVRQICSGLEYAHSRQPSIIHRDIKPANIVVLEDGSVKLVDFGIARLVHSTQPRTGQLMGSVNYVSPEQINHLELDGRSDIFSTGVVLYQLLTSKLPFEGVGTAQTLKHIVSSPAPPLGQFIQEYPRALDHIVARALAKDRDKRYRSASEFSSDLLEVEEQLKSRLFGEFISRAEQLLREGQLDRAKQELLNVVEIDRQHVRANELMRQVMQAVAKKQGQQRARDLQAQAEQALEQKQFGEALSCLEEAIRLNNSNTELQAFRQQVIRARARMEKLHEVLSRAERAYSAGDFEGTSRAVDEAFELDPEAARAKSLNIQIAHKIAEREQERRVQELLALARQHVSARKFAGALEAVKKAESLNPAARGIPELMALAASGDAEEQRRRAVEKSAAEILAALHRSDPSLACKVAQAAVQQFPNEGALVELKARAHRQLERHAGGAEQVSSARALRERAERERRAFLAERAEVAYSTAKREAIPQASSSNSGRRPASRSKPEITSAAINHAARALAHYIGPISGVLAKKAALRADSLRTLYLLLAEHVERKLERDRFLRDAGFPNSQ